MRHHFITINSRHVAHIFLYFYSIHGHTRILVSILLSSLSPPDQEIDKIKITTEAITQITRIVITDAMVTELLSPLVSPPPSTVMLLVDGKE